MWSSKLFAAAAVLSTLVLNVSGHSIVTANQATANAAQRSDVTKGSTTSCTGTQSVAATISGGNVDLVAKNFNAGTDGGLQYTVGLSTTGATGKFSAVTVTTNGPANPPSVTSVPIVVNLGGADCSGGKCVLAFKSNGGFGDCVPLSASAATGNSTAAASSAGTSNTGTGAASAGTAAGTAAAGKKHHHHKGAAAGAGKGAAAAGGKGTGAAAAGGKGKGAAAAGGKGKGAAASGSQVAAVAGGKGGAAAACDDKKPAAKRAARPHPRAWYFEEDNQ